MEISWKSPATPERPAGADRVIYAPAMIYRFGPFELDTGTRRAACRRRAVPGRAAGVRAARAAGREPRAPGVPRRDHREDLGRAHRLGRGGREPREVGAPGARRRRQGAALHQDDPPPGLPLRGAAVAGRRAAIPAATIDRAAEDRRGASCTRAAPCRAPRAPSIAVLPFRLVGDAGPYAAIADALPHELIAELSRLRWLLRHRARLVVPPARPAMPTCGEIGRLLGVRYCLTGTVEIAGARPRRHGRARRHARLRASSGPIASPARSTTCTRYATRSARGSSRARGAGSRCTRRAGTAGGDREPRRLVGLSPRPAAHVPLQPRRTTRRPRALFAARRRAGSRLRARACRPVVRPLPDGLPAPHRRPRRRDRPRAPLRRARPRARPARPVRQLHDGAQLLARGRPRQRPRLARARDRRSARTTRRASTPARGPRRWPAAGSKAASTSISRCA